MAEASASFEKRWEVSNEGKIGIYQREGQLMAHVCGRVLLPALEKPEDSIGSLARAIIEKIVEEAEKQGINTVPADANMHFILHVAVPTIDELPQA